MALRYLSILKKENPDDSEEELMKASLTFALKNFGQFLKFMGTLSSYDIRKSLVFNMNLVEKQFKFLGYVPKSEYKMVSGYAYLISNRTINGKTYILPKKFTYNFKDVFKDGENPYIYHELEKEGSVPGYTKVLYFTI